MNYPKKPLICVPLCRATEGELLNALLSAVEVADLVELRLDCLDPAQLEQVISAFPVLADAAGVSLIITLRAMEEGGQNSLGRNQRIAFWSTIATFCGPAAGTAQFLFDVEADLLFDRSHQSLWDSLGWDRIICSYHDFNGGADALLDTYDRLSESLARVLKIAVTVTDAAEAAAVFETLDRARKEKREIIAIAMGEAGISTRVLGPSRGAFLTYAPLGSEGSTAPGQITVDSLQSLYRVGSINEQTKVAGLIGSPVRHSLSPVMHNAGFKTLRLDAVYLPFEVSNVDGFFEKVIGKNRVVDWPLLGFSVTAPHKSAVVKYMDWLDPIAGATGAVNTIVLKGDELRGYNTDVAGFIEPLKKRMPQLAGLRVAVLGAGGAARSVTWALKQEGAEVVVYARRLEKARLLGEEFGVDSMPMSGATFAGFDIVVNTTPLGTAGAGNGELSVTREQMAGVDLAYDVVFNPIETVFLKRASEAGCIVIGGLEMLIAQALNQMELWTGRRPPEELYRAAAMRGLGPTS
jgi:3-dehydroquinate dehydratase / shikimate dehydrogenase